jgi:hypothetical protein
MRARAGLALVLVAAAFALMASCGPGDFEAQSKVDTVRVFASRADPPYAQPGATVNVEVLAFDGRPAQPEMMQIYWLPFVCINPPQDLYYLCFGGAGAAKDAGADLSPDGGPAAGLGALKPGVDLSPFLPSGPMFSLTLPPDIITTHAPALSGPQYGIAIAFNIACAGHVEIVPLDPTNVNPQQVPVGCFDAQHNRLGPDSYVIGFTRVYAFASLTNANPVIDQVLFQGNPVDLGAGITMTHCTTPSRSDCPDLTIDVDVPPSSQEVDTADIGPDGKPRGEQIWVDYFATIGDLENDARLLYDPTAGRITPSGDNYQAPSTAGEGTMWAVVHDNRGGAAWATIALHVK